MNNNSIIADDSYTNCSLQAGYKFGDGFDKEMPRADKTQPVSHDDDDAVPPLEAAGIGVAQEEGVAEDVAPAIVAK